MSANNHIAVSSLLDYVCCPDCRGDLQLIGTGNTAGYFCPACQTAFPTVDGVLILLDKGSRNARLEAPLLRELAKHADGEQQREACNHTLNLLSAVQSDAYAWEDEKHWTEEYAAHIESGKPKNWNDRLWQRMPAFQVAVDYLNQASKSKSRVVVDIGCGEGQDLRHFLAPHLTKEDVYIGLDISLAGLRLNRKRNPHARSIFILGSADKPPLRPHIANIAICLGTLHHMQAKEKGLAVVAELISEGVILQSDPINGSFLPDSMRFNRASRSVHDDSIDYAEFRRAAEKLNLKIAYERRYSGLVYFILITLFRPLLLNSRGLHRFAHWFDELFIGLLGGIFPLFKPRGLLTALSMEKSARNSRV